MTATIAPRFQKRPDPEVFVGEVKVEVLLENFGDVEAAARGHLSDDQVRRETCEEVVDTGTTSLALPEDLVARLGLRQLGTTRVVYADNRVDVRPVAGVVAVSVSGCQIHVDCVVGPTGSELLLGQVPLELLDLLVDCSQQRLIPRPESPDMTR